MESLPFEFDPKLKIPSQTICSLLTASEEFEVAGGTLNAKKNAKHKALPAAKEDGVDVQPLYDSNLRQSVLLKLNEAAAIKEARFKLSKLGLGAKLEFAGGAANSGNVDVGFVVPTLPALGLALDFDADTISGADSSAIPQWVDSSGNNVVATVAAGSPLLKTGANGIAGHNVVRFATGAARTSYLSFPLINKDWAGLTVYYVARSGAVSGATRYGGVFGWQANGQALNIALGSATDGQGAGWSGPIGSTVLGNVSGYAADTPFYGSYRYDKTHWTIEGVECATVADTSWPTDNVVTAWIGSNYYPGSQSDNDVSRVVVYDRKLTDDEDAQVVNYLKYRYGFSSTAPSQVFRIGYPDTLTNKFAIRYAHPAG
ncbi:MAG: hypothetical protein ACJ8F1_25765, partial [Polyangia bacterium]